MFASLASRRGKGVVYLLCVHTQLLRSIMATAAPENIPVNRLRWSDAPQLLRQFVKVPTMEMHKGQVWLLSVADFDVIALLAQAKH